VKKSNPAIGRISTNKQTLRRFKLQVFHSFEESENKRFDDILNMKPCDRVAAVDEIRKRLFLIKGIKADNVVERKHITFTKR
jgi:hypothetical protein